MQPATRAIPRPSDAQLLVVGANGSLCHTARANLTDFLDAGDLLIANDAATIPASLHGIHQRTDESIEVRLAGRHSLALDDVRDFTAIVFGAGDHRTRTEDRTPPPPLTQGDVLVLGPLRATVECLLGHERLVALRFDGTPDVIWDGVARHGKPIQYAHVEEPLEMWDMWTRIAAIPVAFEPPSASFVLDWELLGSLKLRGVDFVTLTLAAGISSTGDPTLDAAFPLAEPYQIPERTVRAVARTWTKGGRIVAVGTTVARALEHAASRARGLGSGASVATQRIDANSALHVVDAIITGVHEPGSSHYDLLRAFASEHLLRTMSHELERNRFRSHEFGDSVFLERQSEKACQHPWEADLPTPPTSAYPRGSGGGRELVRLT